MRADSNWQLAIDLCISSQQSIQKTAKAIAADQEEVAANFREGTRIKNEGSSLRGGVFCLFWAPDFGQLPFANCWLLG
jgi:hypothetical protein